MLEETRAAGKTEVGPGSLTHSHSSLTLMHTLTHTHTHSHTLTHTHTHSHSPLTHTHAHTRSLTLVLGLVACSHMTGMLASGSASTFLSQKVWAVLERMHHNHRFFWQVSFLALAFLIAQQLTLALCRAVDGLDQRRAVH